jgi:protein-disulfide isomerase/uncharacterized membrane protein
LEQARKNGLFPSSRGGILPPMAARATKTADLEQRRRRLLLPIVTLLLLATAANGYLAHLFYRAKAAPSAALVESFCKISARWDCVTVARSEYAELFGIPIAIYGAEFFGLALAVTLLSGLGRIRLRAWDSLVFAMLLLGLPVSLTMAWIAFFHIRSACLLCSVVYGVNVLALLVLAIAHRGRLGELLREGVRELGKRMKSNATQLTLLLLVALGVSQLFWVPRLMPKAAEGPSLDADPWQAIPTAGLTAGAAQAKVRVEIFTDFQCPFCAQLHHRTHDVLKAHPDKIQIVHRDFPLDQSCNHAVKQPFHEHACAAALLARCAAEQGKFWHFASYLFGNQHSLSAAEIDGYARAVGLDLERLHGCARRPEARQALLQDIEEGIRRGVTGTPTCFLDGKQIPHQQVVHPEFWQRLVSAK